MPSSDPALPAPPRPALQALPPSGIHIFASQLHTHLTGRKVVTVLVRDGREREIVNRDDHYSPHFQVGAARPAGPVRCPGWGPVSPSVSHGHRSMPMPGSSSWARPDT